MIGKAFLPKSLFGRALLILLLPTVLIQMVTLFIFFDKHWDNITRHLSSALAGEVIFIVNQLKNSPPSQYDPLIFEFKNATGIDVYIDPADAFRPRLGSGDFEEFQNQLRADLKNPFTVRRIDEGQTIEVRVRLNDMTLRILTSTKRLESRTIMLYMIWMVGTSVICLLIAIIFLRNQVRPIRRLAEAADNFGRGGDMPGFRPSGASEVRRASRAFIVMRERIKRQLRTRNEMLAVISHDLRTPLTRMKLQLAMLEDKEAVAELQGDVQQMEHMIQEYLNFARGADREEAITVSLRELIEDVVNDYQRMDAPVSFSSKEDMQTDLRVSSFRRVLHNIIDNAVRYGKECNIGLKRTVNYCEIIIDDHGAGIPADKRDEVFKPFSRLDLSRNTKTGGVGLGLSIARDIVMAHGGTITLRSSPAGGLRVVIRLPL